MIFFLQSTQQASLYYFSRVYTNRYTQCDFYHIFTFQKFYACIDDTSLLPNESAWQLLDKQQEVMVWSTAQREIYFQNDKNDISLIFLSTSVAFNIWVITSYFMILKIFCMSLFRHFWFLVPTCFPEIICPRCDCSKLHGILISQSCEILWQTKPIISLLTCLSIPN